MDISKTSKSSFYPLMIAVNEIPHNRRQNSLMVSFFFLDNGNVSSFDDKMLKIPIEHLNEISEKVFNSWTTLVYFERHLSEELSRYLSISLTEEEILNFDLLSFGADWQNTFPILSKIVRIVHCIPASSAELKNLVGRWVDSDESAI